MRTRTLNHGWSCNAWWVRELLGRALVAGVPVVVLSSHTHLVLAAQTLGLGPLGQGSRRGRTAALDRVLFGVGERTGDTGAWG
ncbi:hypothetical protein GCM10010840_29820 [Deinococcus aerolatus]|uniref:Uncharacterized protein n=1 Tax=Deinococcus aerolatus TaxID=522487 RepID=A0ABQ2GED6_9DEIO|nr:hypothetical protein GCM10010840_29820 [Deinococcus aerolatus]